MARNVQHDLPEYFLYKNNMSHAFSGAEISCFATYDVNLAIFMRVWAVRSTLAIATCHKQSISMAKMFNTINLNIFCTKIIYPMLFLVLKSVDSPLTMQNKRSYQLQNFVYLTAQKYISLDHEILWIEKFNIFNMTCCNP